jgi:hypothetical protein
MKKLKLNLDGKMLSKEQMKKVVGGYGENPFCDYSSPYYSEENCCLSRGWSWCHCYYTTNLYNTICTIRPCNDVCPEIHPEY